MRIAGAGVVACALVIFATNPALAMDGSLRSSSRGPSVSATPATGLDPTMQRIVVVGRGFDPRVGIYVGLCVIPPKGEKPTPCGGGVNTSGSDSASAWVSSNPPPYGRTLATPFREGGRFRVVLSVSSRVGDVDCRQIACAVVTRADHTRPGERRFDVLVPVQFS